MKENPVELIKSGALKKGDFITFMTIDKEILIYIENSWGLYNSKSVRDMANSLISIADHYDSLNRAN